MSDNNLYITSYLGQSLYIYHTNDEITFIKIHTISASVRLLGLAVNSNKIYTGTGEGTILVYNKTTKALVQFMDNMCSSLIYSVKTDCNNNLIYTCKFPPEVKILGTNGINFTLLLDNTFVNAYETFIDSKNRLWIGARAGIVVYN
jgi:ligand-binding sensor domain-containing protein